MSTKRRVFDPPLCYHSDMYRIIVALFLLPAIALAHQPVISDFANYDDFRAIEQPDVSKAFYGELTGFPHTYTVTLDTEQELFVQVLVPDVQGIATNINGLIVRELPRGQVEVVAMLPPSDAEWESTYEPFAGDSYLNGPEFRGVLTPGTYLIELGNAENVGTYVLSTGELEQFDGLGYFETIKRIYQVKRFMGKSPLSMLMSPLFTIPLLILLLVLYVGFRFFKKQQYHA